MKNEFNKLLIGLVLTITLSACADEKALISEDTKDDVQNDITEGLNVRISTFKLGLDEEAEVLSDDCVYKNAKPQLPSRLAHSTFADKKGFHFIGVEFERDMSLYALAPKPKSSFDDDLDNSLNYGNWTERHMKEPHNSANYSRILSKELVKSGSSLDYKVMDESRILFRLHNSALFFDVDRKKGPITLAKGLLARDRYAPFYTDKDEIEIDDSVRPDPNNPGKTIPAAKWISVPFYNQNSSLGYEEEGKTCDYVYNLHVVAGRGVSSTKLIIDPVIFNDGGG